MRNRRRRLTLENVGTRGRDARLQEKGKLRSFNDIFRKGMV
jgi:hypothetical protein